MPKSRDPGLTKREQGDGASAPPEQAAVERALERIVERLRPKPPCGTKPARKGTPQK